jgi:hypothetical protein
MKKPNPPLKQKPQADPVTQVNRKQLMRLLYRYKGLLEWEMKYLEGQPGPTVSLHLQREAAVSVAAAAEAESSGGEGGKKQILKARQQDPGELENSCVYYAGSTDSDTGLIDTATPYARALTEFL